MKLSLYTHLIKAVIIFCVLFSFYLVFYDLGKPTLENWDEAWYGEMTKQMLASKDFIVPRWNDTYLLDKPPLYLWISSFFSFLFGLSELSVRLPSAISGFVIIALVLFYSYKKWGIVPALVAFSTIALNNIFIWRARSGNIDVFVTLLIFLSYFLLIQRKKYTYVVLGVIFSGIFLAKASLVFFPLSIFVLHEIFFKRKEISKNILNYLNLFAVFIFISGVWLFLGYLQLGYDFVSYYLLYSDQGVASINLLKFKSDYLDYAYYSLQRRYYYVFIIGILLLVRSINKSTHFLILLFSLLLLLLLSFTEKNNNWYLVPSMPFWSLAIAYAVYMLLKFFKNAKIAVLGVVALVVLISYRTFTINISPILNTYSTLDQAESGRKISTLTKESDVIARLDHLYPATIFYSNRKVLASPMEANTREYFISREDLINKVKKREIKWLSGTIESADMFMKENSDLKLDKIKVNNTEVIIKVI